MLSSRSAEDLFESFLRSREQGDDVDIESLCAQYPMHADELRALLAAHEQVADLLSSASEDSTPVPPSELMAQLRATGVRGARYRILDELGRGGMGVVYLVWDDELRRKMAMKVVGAPGVEVDSRTLARFLSEAQITGQLDHPGIVPVHEIGLADDGRAYFTMRRVPGTDLRSVFAHVRTGTDGWNQVRALRVLMRVCEAMRYSHSKGILHRDLKPANIMVGRFGEVYVMDWGLARALGQPDTHDLRLQAVPATDSAVHTERDDQRDSDPDSPLITMDGQVIGTPAYMAPEQARGEIELVGPHSDVYSVGAMLYQLISAEIPFVPSGARLSRHTILNRVIEGPPRPLAHFGRSAPVELVAICEKAMAREIGARYPDMQALAADLLAFEEGRVVTAHATGTWAETRKWVQRNPWLAGASLGLLALLALLAAGLAFFASYARLGENLRVAQLGGDLEKLANLSSRWETVAEPLDTSQWLKAAHELVRELDPAKEKFEALIPRASLDADVAAARAYFPRTQELEQCEAELLWRRRMLKDDAWPSEAQARSRLKETRPPDDLAEQNSLAFAWVRPDRPYRTPGMEMEAFLLIDDVVSKARGSPRFRWWQDTRAFALYRIGRTSDAVAQQEEVVRNDQHPDLLGNLRILEAEHRDWTDNTEARVTKSLQDRISVMQNEIEALAHSRTLTRESFVGSAWAIVVADLTNLRDRLLIQEQALPNAEHGKSWPIAIESIRKSPKYSGLLLTPQIDLVPIREDPISGLWEFAHLPSGEPAQPGPDGRLVTKRSTGLVMVLLPEGRVPVEDGQAPGPLNQVTLAPFFLSKYEMTYGQWFRLGGRWMGVHTLEHARLPVRGVSWNDCQATLRRAGWLRLPTEAQWEYGCRAGTKTRWWTGNDETSLAGAAEINDWPRPFPWVGVHRVNEFGLEDTHGGSAEWCLDAGGADAIPCRPYDGLRDRAGALNRMIRGGHCYSIREDAASGYRWAQGPPSGYADGGYGLRPARPLTR